MSLAEALSRRVPYVVYVPYAKARPFFLYGPAPRRSWLAMTWESMFAQRWTTADGYRYANVFGRRACSGRRRAGSYYAEYALITFASARAICFMSSSVNVGYAKQVNVWSRCHRALGTSTRL